MQHSLRRSQSLTETTQQNRNVRKTQASARSILRIPQAERIARQKHADIQYKEYFKPLARGWDFWYSVVMPSIFKQPKHQCLVDQSLGVIVLLIQALVRPYTFRESIGCFYVMFDDTEA